MLDSSYLGDLGGLSAQAGLVLLDPRGTGASATPADRATYRCDRQVDDVEALREQLGLASLDLLGHSAGASLALLYAARHPEHVGRLLLVTPSIRSVGITVTTEQRREVIRLREGEPWFAEAWAAFERINADKAEDADWDAVVPVTYGRWDAVAQAHHAAAEEHRNEEAAELFMGAGAFDPPATHDALASLSAPVLVVAGGLDANTPPSAVDELAGLLPDATVAILAEGGHYPWLDEPTWFAETTAAFLR